MNRICGIISCQFCESELKDPVILPCGETICSEHEAEFKKSKCMFCKKKHSLCKPDHYPPNKMIKSLLEAQIKSLDLGEVHSKALLMLQKLKNKIQIHEDTLDLPEDTIYDYFNTLRNSIDLEREKMLEKIHECSDKLLSDISALEDECKANLANQKKFKLEEKENLAKIKHDLNKWEGEVNCLVVNERLWSTIEQQSRVQFDALEKRNGYIKTELLLGKKRKQEIEASFFDVRSKFEEFVDFESMKWGKCQLEIPKLSSYTDIKSNQSINSSEIMYLKSLPFTFFVEFFPIENDIKCGVYLNFTKVKEMFKQRKWELNFAIAITLLDKSNNVLYKIPSLEAAYSSEFEHAGFGWKIITVKEILSKMSSRDLNDEDSMLVDVKCRVLEIKFLD